jgi:hypothetical protein
MQKWYLLKLLQELMGGVKENIWEAEFIYDIFDLL